MVLTRRAIVFGLYACLVADTAQARVRYYRRRRKPAPPIIVDPEPPRAVRTVRIIPLPGRLVPSFLDVWAERVGWWLK